MSEQVNNPEQQKPLPRLYDNCNNCEQDYDLTPENTTLHLHEVNDDCDYVRMTCDHCKHIWMMFGIADEFIINAVRHGIDPELLRYPRDSVLTARLGQLGIELVQPVDITARHELLVSTFAETLQNCPDDLLYNLITDESDFRPHPQRWN